MFAQSQYKVFTIPYIVKSNNQNGKVSYEMEVAAIFCLALCHRRKTRIIFGKLEDLGAISKIYYPLICMPWMNKCVIIDGLGLTYLSFSDRSIPDLTYFIETLKKSRANLSSFIEAMEAGAKIFEKILEKNKKEKKIEYLVRNIKLVNVLTEWLKEKESFARKNNSIIPPRISMNDCEKIVENISKEWRRWKTEISMLKYTLQILNEEANHHTKKLSRESEQIWLEYRGRLADIERNLSERIKLIIGEREREIKDILNSYKKRINSIRREREKLERTIYRMKQTLEKNLKKKRNKGKNAKKRTSLDERIKFYKEKINALTKDIRRLAKLEEKIQKEKDSRVREIEEKYEILIANEREKLKILKESRDIELARVNENARKIESTHSAIIKQIGQLIKEKESLVKMIEECTLPLKIDEPAVIGVPLYAAKYRRGPNKIRLNFYPPAKTIDPIKIFKGDKNKFMQLTLKERISMFLKPLSQDLNNTILRNLNEIIRVDSHLKEKIERIIRDRNLLSQDHFLEILEIGLRKLEADGWISSQEKNSILNFLRP